jgi:WD40 repeat protein
MRSLPTEIGLPAISVGSHEGTLRPGETSPGCGLSDGATIGYSGEGTSSAPVPKIAGYDIFDELGRGGMGVVYKAHQTKLNRVVALKMILSGDLASVADISRFRREAEAIAHLQHPNIIHIHEIGDHDGRPFFSLEFAAGGSLQQQLSGTPQAATRAAELTATLARAVAHAHAHGVVHRDLKPGNVLFVAESPKITDFGLAKRLEDTDSSTRTGSILGTPCYMAPEQARGEVRATGPAADIYSLGAMMYEMLTGRPPFRAESKLETIRQVVTDDPVPPRRLQSRVPVDLETICLKCLRKEASHRYASAAALADDLDRFLAGQPIQARPTSAWEKGWKWAKRRPAVAALLLLSLVLTAAGFGLVTWQWREAEEARRLAEREEQAKQVALTNAVTAQAETEKARQTAENGRVRAETAEQREITEREKADRARQVAVDEKQKFQRLSADLLLDRGIAQAEQDDVGRGLLWMARALRVAPDDADLQRTIRVNLDDWGRKLHPLKSILPHARRVLCVAYSPDGKLIATGSADSSARLWDAETGAPVGKPLQSAGWIIAVAFSPDGQTLAAATNNGTGANALGLLNLWDVSTGKAIGQPMKLQHSGEMLAISFSPDGSTLLSVAKDKAARLWDLTTREPIGEPLTHDDVLRVGAFSPDGKTVLTASVDKTARLWDPKTGKALTEPLPHRGIVNTAAFSPDSKLVVTGTDGEARLWAVPDGKPVGEAMIHNKQNVTRVTFQPKVGGKVVVTVSSDGTVQLWQAPSGKPIGQAMKHRSQVWSLAISPDGKTIATGCLDQTARLWDSASSLPLGAPLPHQSEVYSVIFSPDSQSLATVTYDRMARLWQVPAPVSGTYRLGTKSQINSLAYSPDSKMVVAGNLEKVAQRWDVVTGKQILPLLAHQDRVNATAFSRDGKTIATASWDKTVQLWDTNTGVRLGDPLMHDGMVTSVAFSPDGTTVMTGSIDKSARLWDVATSKLIGKPLPHAYGVTSVAFSPDGKTVLTGSFDKTARLWDTSNCNHMGEVMKHDGYVYVAAFSPDGKTVATVSEDETARFWDAATGKPLCQPMKHHSEVRALAFSPDGKLLLTGSEDRTARFWRVPTGEPVRVPLTHQRGIRTACFHKDGRTVLTGSLDGTARLWDTATGKPLGSPILAPVEVYAVAISPDGKTFACGGGGGYLWIRHMPDELKGDVERIVLWAQLLTGLELSEDGTSVGILDAEKLKEQRQRLEQLGGPPMP